MMHTPIRRDEHGGIPVITVLVLFVTFALLGLIGATTTLSVDSLSAVNRSTATTQGTTLADSALNAFYSYVEEHPNALATGTYKTSFPDYGTWAAFEADGQIEACKPSPRAQPDVAPSGQGCFELKAFLASNAATAGKPGPLGSTTQPQETADVTVTAHTGCAGNIASCTTTTVSQMLRRKTFLDYLYFFNHNRIDTGILPLGMCAAAATVPMCYPAWVTGDVVHGPLHTNGSTVLPICGHPVFTTTPEVTETFTAVAQRQGCAGSLQPVTPTPVLPLPTGDSNLQNIAAAGGTPWAGQQGYAFSGNITVEITDNTLTITAPDGTVHSGVPFPTTGVIYADGNIFVSGTNTGQLTIAAGGNIGGNITVTRGNVGGLLYASPPGHSDGCTTSPPAATCKAVTGLVATKTIKLSYSQQPLTVDAAMLSLTHSVRISPIPSFSTGNTTSAPPPPRADASMAHDSPSGNIVLFGGTNGQQDMSDTWNYDGTTWTQQSPSLAPRARYDAPAAYDRSTGTTVLFGGQHNTYNTYTGSTYATTLGSTWTYNGTTWAPETPTASPSGRYSASMAYDPATGSVVLFGGDNDSCHYVGPATYVTGIGNCDGTWTYNGSTWAKQSPATSPPPRAGASMAYDPATGNLVLYGGYETTGFETIYGNLVQPFNFTLGGTWTYNGSTWTRQSPATSPPPRAGASMAYDPAIHEMVLFGGYEAYVNYNYLGQPISSTRTTLGGTWTYNGSTWTRQSPANSPSPRAGASMAYDPAIHEMVLFGGHNGSDYFGGTWTYNGTTWARQSKPGQSAKTNVDACPKSGCPTLTINGAMATDYRGIFGAYDASSGLLDQGWHKSFFYDTRLFHIEPPWFLSQTTGQWVRSAPVQGR